MKVGSGDRLPRRVICCRLQSMDCLMLGLECTFCNVSFVTRDSLTACRTVALQTAMRLAKRGSTGAKVAVSGASSRKMDGACRQSGGATY